MSAADGVRVDPELLKAFAAGVLGDVGMRPEDASVTAELLVRADVRGTHTHGIRYLPIYLPLLRGGGIRVDARPRVVTQTAGSAVIDGDGGMGHVVARMATDTAIGLSRENGFGATVLVRNSNHFGPNGTYALMCAEAGMIGIVTSNSVPVMGAPGAAGKVISNSPIAYAVPSGDPAAPIALDIAFSRTAGSRVLMALSREELLDDEVIVDADGALSRDPRDYVNGGALAPLGGHKGYGLAVLVEVLSGVLSGAGITDEVLRYADHPDTPSRTGHAIIAINVEAFMPMDEFTQRIGRLRDHIHGAPPAKNGRPMLPGEPEIEHARDTHANGLELDPVTWRELEGAAAETGRGDDLRAAVKEGA